MGRERYFDLIFKAYINDMIYILRLIFSSDSCTDRIIMQNVIYINRPCNKSTQLKWTFIVLNLLKSHSFEINGESQK